MPNDVLTLVCQRCGKVIMGPASMVLRRITCPCGSVVQKGMKPAPRKNFKSRVPRRHRHDQY